MDAYYFNLDSAVERNRDFLKNYHSAEISSMWVLHRYAAAPVPTRLTGIADSRLIAHHENRLGGFKHSLRDDNHVIFMDDDVVLSKHADRHVDALIHKLIDIEWDVVFLDLLVVNSIFFPKLYKMLAKAKQSDTIDAVCLNGLNLTHSLGTTMLVNGKSKLKLYDLLNVSAVNYPIDLYLRQYIFSGAVKGYFTVPFLSTLSIGADSSTLTQNSISDTVLYHAFNRLMWIDGYFNECTLSDFKKSAEAKGFIPSPELEAMGLITQMLLGRQLEWHTPVCGFEPVVSVIRG